MFSENEETQNKWPVQMIMKEGKDQNLIDSYINYIVKTLHLTACEIDMTMNDKITCNLSIF